MIHMILMEVMIMTPFLVFDNSDKTIDDSGLALGGDEDDLDDSSDSVIIPLDNDANNGVDND